ncbi:unnamed protein product, partial [Nesidiocoris tenuis]
MSLDSKDLFDELGTDCLRFTVRTARHTRPSVAVRPVNFHHLNLTKQCAFRCTKISLRGMVTLTIILILLIST